MINKLIVFSVFLLFGGLLYLVFLPTHRNVFNLPLATTNPTINSTIRANSRSSKAFLSFAYPYQNEELKTVEDNELGIAYSFPAKYIGYFLGEKAREGLDNGYFYLTDNPRYKENIDFLFNCEQEILNGGEPGVCHEGGLSELDIHVRITRDPENFENDESCVEEDYYDQTKKRIFSCIIRSISGKPISRYILQVPRKDNSYLSLNADVNGDLAQMSPLLWTIFDSLRLK